MTLSATVVISTRGRPRGCADAVASVLLALGRPDDLVVVDQSEDDATRVELEHRFAGEPRLSYASTRRIGISAGHNLGAAQTRTDVLLFTDDDCTVSQTWIEEWRRTFAADASIGIGFGTVDCQPFDARKGFTPHFKPEHDDVHGIEVFEQPTGTIGMGANTAVSRRAWDVAGGCDEQLGVGTRFGGAEELDLAYRILRLGFKLAHAARPLVMHDGFRPNEAASALVQTNGMGTGAMYGKHVRCRDGLALRLLARDVASQIMQSTVRLATNQRPLGIRRLRSILLGALLSSGLPLDRRRRVYVSDQSMAAPEMSLASTFPSPR